MKTSPTTLPREDTTKPVDFSVNAIPTENLEQYGAVVLRASTKKPPKPSRIPFTKAIVIVDRKWRQIHGKKIMPAVHRPYCNFADGKWTIRRSENRETLACVVSTMVIIGWTMKLDEDAGTLKKKTVYSQENHAFLDDSVMPENTVEVAA